MKSLFLVISIAASATPASARPWTAFYCGKVQVALIPGNISIPLLEAANPFATVKPTISI